jgi:ribosomal protein S12 methylthiotransferase
LENNRKHIGRVYDVLVEETTEENHFIGRTYFQAPEVDGITYIHSDKLKIGSFANVMIKDAFEYDLAGEIA